MSLQDSQQVSVLLTIRVVAAQDCNDIVCVLKLNAIVSSPIYSDIAPP